MLRAILWPKAHMSYLESRRRESREGFLQSQRRNVNESEHLNRQKPVGRAQEMEGQRYRQNSLSDLGRPDQGLPFQHSDCHAFFIPS